MKYLWKFPMHREAFKREAQNTQSFLGFVNMLINDSIYLLDESLAKLAKIRSTQVEMSSPDWVTRYNVVSTLTSIWLVPLNNPLHVEWTSWIGARTRAFRTHCQDVFVAGPRDYAHVPLLGSRLCLVLLQQHWFGMSIKALSTCQTEHGLTLFVLSPNVSLRCWTTSWSSWSVLSALNSKSETLRSTTLILNGCCVKLLQSICTSRRKSSSLLQLPATLVRTTTRSSWRLPRFYNANDWSVR